jgi:CRISPR-associated endonuclease/helicase Cas3
MFDPKEFYAHTPNQKGDWQKLDAHLLGVANRTAELSAKFGASDLGYTAGLLHDIGKFRPEFKDYLWRCYSAPTTVRRGEVPHAAFGCFFCEGDYEVLWPIIAGHHGGIYHYDSDKMRDLLDKRRVEFDTLPPEAITFLDQHRLTVIYPERFMGEQKAEVLLRMLFSCLVDADSEDTAKHKDTFVELHYPCLTECRDWFEEKYQETFHKQGDGEGINHVRNRIYADCIAQATNVRGFYRLTAPTGGGKTLSSLAFALYHALHHVDSSQPLSRIIYAAPYTAIIDQTAERYRAFLPPGAVLEHHSAVAPEDTEDQTAREVRRREETERWEAPFIVTTTVQLFESLFSNRRSKCRKLHNIANSVIILDEAQCLPPHVLLPTLAMLNVLVEAFGCTVLFCTATQPAWSALNKILAGNQHLLPPTNEIIHDVTGLFKACKRVEYDLSLTQASLTIEQLADKVGEQFQTTQRVLVIVNTKQLALDLWKALKDLAPVHLSTLLCPAHRTIIIDAIANGPCCVISTQVVEAGVDLDFPVVFREFGPLDRIVQAAGRCNRNGIPDMPPFGRIFVFSMEKVRLPPGSYHIATDAARTHLHRGVDLNDNDPATYEAYFRLFYRQLADMGQAIEERRSFFDYPEVSKRYRLIPDETVPVLVTVKVEDDPKAQHTAEDVAHKGFATPTDWQILQRYCVSVRRDEIKRRLDPLLLDEDWIPGLHRWRGYYHPQLGLGETVQFAIEDIIA